MDKAIRVQVPEQDYLRALNARWEAHGFMISSFLDSAVLAYGDVAGQSRRKWWVEKTPSAEFHVKELARWYPGLRIIFVVRDPRANYSSLKKWRSRTHGSMSVPRFAFEWGESVERNERNGRVYPVLTLRYEDLVHEPHWCMGNVCRFLGISFDQSLVSPSIGGQQFEGNSVFGEKFSSISTSPFDRWKQLLSYEEVSLLEDLLGPRMREFGYEPTARGEDLGKMSRRILLGRLKKNLYAIHGTLPQGSKTVIRRVLSH